MASCGLQEMLELIYAPNAVVHMLSGKAISRALRGHFIVDAALNALMLKSVLNAPLPCQPEVSENEDPDLAPSDEQCADVGKSLDLDEACTLYEKLMARDISAEEVCKVDVLTRIKDSLQKYSESVKMSSRTSALWVQYMNMMDILRRYIRAERTGNWALHLQAILPTWQPQAITTTPNQPQCICRRCPISRLNILMFNNVLMRGST